jgi:hypothetical protein
VFIDFKLEFITGLKTRRLQITTMAGCFGKTVVFIINLIFLFCGIAVLVFGILTLSSPSTIIDALSFIPGYQSINYIIDIQQAVINGGIVMTVVGSVLVVICIFGIIASCTSSTCFIATYIGMILVILYFEIAVIIFFSVDSQFVERRIQNLMYTSLKDNFEPVDINGSNIDYGSTPGAVAWESLQFQYSCCGAHNYTDYNTFNWQTNFTYMPNATVPPSCCQQINQYEADLPNTTSTFSNLNTCLTLAPEYTNPKGCYTALSEYFFIYGYVKMITLGGLIAIEVLVLMFTCRLLHLNKMEKEIGVDY